MPPSPPLVLHRHPQAHCSCLKRVQRWSSQVRCLIFSLLMILLIQPASLRPQRLPSPYITPPYKASTRVTRGSARSVCNLGLLQVQGLTHVASEQQRSFTKPNFPSNHHHLRCSQPRHHIRFPLVPSILPSSCHLLALQPG